MANAHDDTQVALKFNNKYSGTKRIDHIMNLIHNPETLCVTPHEPTSSLRANRENVNDFFGKLCLEVDKQPCRFTATCTYDIFHIPFIPITSL
jgi:hypothetical protein